MIDEYTDKTEFPIIKEVCFFNDWNYDYVMELQRGNEELSQSIKRLLTKKEIALERGVHAGTIDRTFAIFTLKQHAHNWSDVSELDIKVKKANLQKIKAESAYVETKTKQLKDGSFIDYDKLKIAVETDITALFGEPPPGVNLNRTMEELEAGLEG